MRVKVRKVSYRYSAFPLLFVGLCLGKLGPKPKIAFIKFRYFRAFLLFSGPRCIKMYTYQHWNGIVNSGSWCHLREKRVDRVFRLLLGISLFGCRQWVRDARFLKIKKQGFEDDLNWLPSFIKTKSHGFEPESSRRESVSWQMSTRGMPSTSNSAYVKSADSSYRRNRTSLAQGWPVAEAE